MTVEEKKINKYEYFKPYFSSLKMYILRNNPALLPSSTYLCSYSRDDYRLYRFMWDGI